MWRGNAGTNSLLPLNGEIMTYFQRVIDDWSSALNCDRICSPRTSPRPSPVKLWLGLELVVLVPTYVD
jgi:hypothetical protein